MTGYLGVIGAALMLYSLTSNLWVVGIYLVIAEAVFTWTKIQALKKTNDEFEAFREKLEKMAEDIKEEIETQEEKAPERKFTTSVREFKTLAKAKEEDELKDVKPAIEKEIKDNESR
jgi:predicted tellurium resistance membrane protein TerC